MLKHQPSTRASVQLKFLQAETILNQPIGMGSTL